MNTIYIHRRFQEKTTLSIRKTTVEEINNTDIHMQCSSMRNTPSHVSQTKRCVFGSKTEQKITHTKHTHTTIEQRGGVGQETTENK